MGLGCAETHRRSEPIAWTFLRLAIWVVRILKCADFDRAETDPSLRGFHTARVGSALVEQEVVA